MAKRVVVTGGTGFIGRELTRQLVERGYEVAIPSLHPDKGNRFGRGVRVVGWDARTAEGWGAEVDGAHAVVNLAGENIAGHRWSGAQKRRIRESRLNAGAAVVQAMEQAGHKPAVLVQGSAIGYYGDRGEEALTEDASPGDGFLSETTVAWERSTARVEELGVRRAVARTALVLGEKGGVLQKFLTPMRLFLGGPLGSGRQWMSWIHRRDEAAAIIHLLENESSTGPYNLASPDPVRMREFCRTLGAVVSRPCWLPAPAFALKAALGEMADELLLAGQRVLPARLQAEGFRFAHTDLEATMREILY